MDFLIIAKFVGIICKVTDIRPAVFIVMRPCMLPTTVYRNLNQYCNRIAPCGIKLVVS